MLNRGLRARRDFIWAPGVSPYLLEKGSEVWAPVLSVVYPGVTMGFFGFRSRGPIPGTIGSTLHCWLPSGSGSLKAAALSERSVLGPNRFSSSHHYLSGCVFRWNPMPQRSLGWSVMTGAYRLLVAGWCFLAERHLASTEMKVVDS